MQFPQIRKHRGARRHKGQYYGPFASAGSVTRTLNALQKLFLLRSCTDTFLATRKRPCLLYQIRRCSAPCVGRVTPEAYAELVQDAKDFLAGKSSQVQQKLAAAMNEAAEAMDYELAAVFRDRLRSLTFIQGTQTIAAEGLGDADIFALACKGGTMCVQAFFIRGGNNWGHRSFFPAHTADVPEAEVLASFLMQFYEEVPPPRQMLLDREVPEAELLAEALSERAGPQGDHPGAEARRPCPDDPPGLAQRRGGARPPPRRDQHPGEDDAGADRDCSSCPSRPSGSRSTTTATSWAPTRSGR